MALEIFLSFEEGFANAEEHLGISSMSDFADMLEVRMALVTDAKRRNTFPTSWLETVKLLTTAKENIMESTKEFLKAAAAAVEMQQADNPGLGIPVDPEVAEHMGAFTETALNEDDLDEEYENDNS